MKYECWLCGSSNIVLYICGGFLNFGGKYSCRSLLISTLTLKLVLVLKYRKTVADFFKDLVDKLS